MHNKIREHEDICRELHELYVKKNADYGDSVGQLYSKLGDITLFTRISDKYHRLENMLSNPDKPINYESMDDNIEDMANYCAIWLTERRIKRQREMSKCELSSKVSGMEQEPFKVQLVFPKCPECKKEMRLLDNVFVCDRCMISQTI